MRASRLALTLPDGVAEAADGQASGAIVTALDAASLAEASERLGRARAGQRIAWALPVSRPGLVGWIACRASGLRPIVLEDACAALRRAGVVDVRVRPVAGTLPLVVVSGRASGP